MWKFTLVVMVAAAGCAQIMQEATLLPEAEVAKQPEKQEEAQAELSVEKLLKVQTDLEDVIKICHETLAEVEPLLEKRRGDLAEVQGATEKLKRSIMVQLEEIDALLLKEHRKVRGFKGQYDMLKIDERFLQHKEANTIAFTDRIGREVEAAIQTRDELKEREASARMAVRKPSPEILPTLKGVSKSLAEFTEGFQDARALLEKTRRKFQDARALLEKTGNRIKQDSEALKEVQALASDVAVLYHEVLAKVNKAHKVITEEIAQLEEVVAKVKKMQPEAEKRLEKVKGALSERGFSTL
jgi:hypothetical protein